LIDLHKKNRYKFTDPKGIQSELRIPDGYGKKGVWISFNTIPYYEYQNNEKVLIYDISNTTFKGGIEGSVNGSFKIVDDNTVEVIIYLSFAKVLKKNNN